MFVSPLDIEYVLSWVGQLVGDSVPPVSLMLHIHLVTRLLRAVDAHEEDVVPGVGAVNRERVLFTKDGSVKAGSLAGDRAAI